MWCRSCQQDVPATSAAPAAGYSCARCGGNLAHDEERHTERMPSATSGEAGTRRAAQPSRANFDEWRVEQDLRQLQAKVGHWQRVSRAASHAPAAPQPAPVWRIDAAHAQPRRPHERPRGAPLVRSPISWCAITLGLMTSVCGAVLILWSLVARRPELWTLGMPIAVAGQAALVLGLVLRLERIAEHGRHLQRSLERVELELAELEHSTSLVNQAHGSASQAFYAHLAEQANPQLLLADLKGQLDLLAMHMARRSA